MRQVSSNDEAVVCAAATVADLLAVAPARLGGVAVRAGAGPVRDAFVAALAARLPTDAPMRKIPIGVSEDRLTGGLDLAATLSRGAPVFQRGLLAELDGGLALVPMAERLMGRTVTALTIALDRQEVVVERDGFTARAPTHLGIVALDEGGEADAELAPALTDRLAFKLDLSGLSYRAAKFQPADHARIDAARRALDKVTIAPAWIDALVSTASALGIASIRPALFAATTARIAAALDGRSTVEEADAVVATDLVLAPRATQIPISEESDKPEQTSEPTDPPPDSDSEPPEDVEPSAEAASGAAERLVEAARASLPPGLLATLASGASRAPSPARGEGAATASFKRGRPVGTRPGRPVGGARIDLVETLKAAAPWQPLRRGDQPDGRFRVRAEDLRIRRFKDRRETLTVFVVDASGSVAATRLAEVKGGIELILSESYARRDYVALVAFSGTGAELLLPPTRSLTRAKRLLAALPGGGGTPLAAGLDAALRVAADADRAGRTPSVVVLSDGRANVTRDGKRGRAEAAKDADAAARALARAGLATLVIDTAPRGSDDAKRIAETAAARYLWLPRADAAAIKNAASPALQAD